MFVWLLGSSQAGLGGREKLLSVQQERMVNALSGTQGLFSAARMSS